MWSFADPVVLAWRLDWWGGFDGGGVSVGRGGARECAMRELFQAKIPLITVQRSDPDARLLILSSVRAY